MDKMKNRSSFLFRSWNDEGLRALCACIEHGGRQDPVLPPCSDAKTMVKEHDAGTVVADNVLESREREMQMIVYRIPMNTVYIYRVYMDGYKYEREI